MAAADDHASAPQGDFDLDTDEGLEAYLLDLARRRPVPESLRYPETDEEYDRMIKGALAEIDRGESFSLEEVRARFADRIATARRG